MLGTNEFKAGIDREEFVGCFDIKGWRGFAVGLDMEIVFLIDTLLVWTFFSDIEFENGLKVGGNLDAVFEDVFLKAWLAFELSKLRNGLKGKAISKS